MQQLHLRLLTEQARAGSLKAKSKTLADQHTTLLADLRTLNRHEGRVTRLKNDVARLQTAFKTYSEKYEQARIDWALGEQRISNVNVVQPPTFVTKPVAPKKRLIALLGAIVAGIAGIAFAYLLEWRARQRDDETDFDAPPQREPILRGMTQQTV